MLNNKIMFINFITALLPNVFPTAHPLITYTLIFYHLARKRYNQYPKENHQNEEKTGSVRQYTRQILALTNLVHFTPI